MHGKSSKKRKKNVDYVDFQVSMSLSDSQTCIAGGISSVKVSLNVASALAEWE